ncbi:MAG TPA: hypothetical protein RMH99_10400 [Sandaracinaceae bacterium LLY-WYZ-13_1]|nr:hypothetical protein [Sandaracinaceae bacterium LLY-WYZ-13_1]
MGHGVPFFLLAAETEAWPFTARAAYRMGTTKLEREREHLVLAEETEALWAEAERDLRHRAGGLSLDALRQLRNHAWFDARRADETCSEPPCSRTLEDVLVSLARRYLHWHGRSLELRRPTTRPLGDAAARWRWLSTRLPPDLLVAARAAEREGTPPGEHVDIATKILGDTLQRGVALTHVHLSGVGDFPYAWAATMAALRSRRVTVEELADEDTGVHAHELIYAAITRWLLAGFLAERREAERRNPECSPRESFADFTGRLFAGRSAHDGGESRIIARAAEPADALRSLEAVLAAVLAGRGADPEEELRALLAYRAVTGAEPSDAETLEELVRRDPLAARLDWRRRQALPETRFLAEALRFLRSERERERDELFAQAFWQYVRLRSFTYRHLVALPGTGGLDWFRRFFARFRPFNLALRQCAFETAMDIESEGIALQSMELRWTPPRRARQVRDHLRRVVAQAARYELPPGVEPPEIGVIFHFRKENRDERAKPHEAPCEGGPRYERWARDQGTRADAIAQALTDHPELLLVLRGIDVASSELAIPTWAVAHVMRRVRRESKRAAERLHRWHPELAIPPLRATFHCGEEFRRLMSGLRAVHEPLEAGVIGPGDRLGHALALGADVEEWAAKGRFTWQPRLERLADLLWELDRYRGGDVPTQSSRVEWIRAEAEREARHIFGIDRLAPLALLRRRLLAKDFLGRLEFPHLKRADLRTVRLTREDASVRDPLEAYLFDEACYRRGAEAVEVELTDHELEALRALQGWLRGQVAKREITIETNPSSNLFVGDLADMNLHPAVRFADVQGAGETLSISINDDDPLVCATRIVDEYAYVYLALIRAGRSSARALDWIDAARRAGLASRFTLPASRALFRCAASERERVHPLIRELWSDAERG